MTAVSSKPLYLQPKPDAIPVPLKRWPSWVVWRGMYKPGEKKEWTKPPFRPDGSLADSTDTETWAPYDKVLRAYLNGEFDGIGLQLGGVPNLVGIDLDNCRDPATREIAGWALDIITALDTYFEVSLLRLAFVAFSTASCQLTDVRRATLRFTQRADMSP